MITDSTHLNSYELPVSTEPPLLDIRLRRSTRTIGIELIGDLDISTAPELWKVLAAVIVVGHEEIETVAIDLSRLNYTDSSGLGCFVAAHERCAASGIKLQLLQPDVILQRIFEITGLDHTFDIDRRPPTEKAW